MKYVWPVLLGVFRTAYAAYSLWCLLFPVAVAALLWALSSAYASRHPGLSAWALAGFGVFLMAAFYGVLITYRHRSDDDPNPWQSGFMAWFGTLKLFRNLGGAAAVQLFWPSSYLVENPRGYRISGVDMREILSLLQPGDMLLRGYEGYVDGEFIRRSSLTSKNGFQPGWFTHVALYVGDLAEADDAQVPAAFRDQPDYFSPGPQRVIHAMAKGVHTEDILTFLRCDYLAVLRLPEALLQGPAVAAARQSALEKIGEAYDFDCSDTEKFDRFSCAELLYYCLREVLSQINLKPLPHAFYPLAPRFPQLNLLERVTITPDDYYDLSRSGKLQCVWEDSFSKTLP